MSDDELEEALAELEDTRQAAERELQRLQAHREVLEELERNKDALLESYARMVPEELDRLSPEERHHVYKILRIKVIVYPNGDVEVSGALRDCFTPQNQYERGTAAHYEIELPVAGAVVALDEGVAAPGQVA